MHPLYTITALLLLCVPTYQPHANQLVEEVLPPLDVALANRGDFQTSLAYHNGAVYTVNVEPVLPSTGTNLHTVIRKGVRGTDGLWTWQSKILEDRTIDDQYHTQASLAVDKYGYIHVAFNMHNMPWQYMISSKPGDIANFEFHGESVSDDEIAEVKHSNRTPFPFYGTASIPGTQVTYPAFFHDRNNDLYITYRFALKPKRAWKDRVYGCGIARYDAGAREWNAIGGEIMLSIEDATFKDSRRSVKTVCAQPEQWANRLRLAFDDKNNMHLVWAWYDYTAFARDQKPAPVLAYAFSTDSGETFQRSDGTSYTLPISAVASEVVLSLAPGEHSRPQVISHRGVTSIFATPSGGPYQFLAYDLERRSWKTFAQVPASTHTVISDEKSIWAFATGPQVFKADAIDSNWNVVVAEQDRWGYIVPIYVDQARAIFLQMMKCENSHQALSTSDGKCKIRILRLAING